MDYSTILSPTTFCSDDELPDRFFSGYGFDHLDFFVGPRGLREFETERQRRFSGTDDGCYIICDRDEKGHTISTDPKGLCKLFLYQRKGNWAVSNSFSTLMDLASEKSWKTTPDYAILDAWTLPPNTFGATFSRQTVVKEITLLSPVEKVTVANGEPLIKIREELNRLSNYSDYETSLNRFLQVWLGRILTLANSEALDTAMELTGGLDSRIALAFYLHLKDRGSLSQSSKIRIFCAENGTPDHAIATSLSEFFEFELSKGSYSGTHFRSATERFTAWRVFSLGMYTAPYVPSANHAPNRLTFGAHGGERLRKTKGAKSISAYADEYTQSFRSRRRAAKIKSAAEKNLESIPANSPMSAEFLDYCNHRLRFHHSHLAQYELRTPPLMSVHLDRCLSLLDDNQQNHGVLLFDIMQRLNSSLLSHPFDDPEKSPSHDVLGQLGAPFKGKIEQGKVFAEFDHPSGTHSKDTSDWTNPFVEAYEESRSRTLPFGLQPSIFAETDSTVEKMARTKLIPKRRDFQAVHAVLLSALLAKSRTSRSAMFFEGVKLLPTIAKYFARKTVCQVMRRHQI